MRLGVDVGGTNTDSVLVDGNKILSWHKSPTTQDISSGIVNSVNKVLDKAAVAPAAIEAVMIGTTQFTNAFVERKFLERVGIIRIALPATSGLPPLTDWPAAIKACMGDCCHLVRGGYQYDGRINSELDERAIASAARNIKKQGIKAVAVSALFSPVNSAMEVRAEEILKNEIPDVAVTLSHQMGRLGLLERENAAIMNASLVSMSERVVDSFQQALQGLAISAPFYISQNDGTLMTSECVKQFPVLTFASGPTNSMRGAAYLSGIKNALVADIGGTTTDIGMLINGFPRESSITVDIGGVRTNFRMPDILALPLGGGSLIRNDGAITVGPDSVGYRITEQARVFGGDTLTASDIAVAAGYASLGNADQVADLPAGLITEAVTAIHRIIETGVDSMKTSAEPVPLILVGGGAILVANAIPGVSDVIVPDHAAVANAVGASIAQIGGEIDRVYSYGKLGREQALQQARDEATRQAVSAGARPDTIEIVDLEEVPLAYVPGEAVRIRAKAVGALADAVQAHG